MNPSTTPRLQRRRLGLALGLLPWAAHAQAPVTVRAVTETWDRVLFADPGGRPQGPVANFVGRMNAIQQRFRFELELVPRLRLEEMLRRKQADMYPLRTLDWVDPGLGLLATDTVVTTGDIYIARRGHPLGAKVFTDLPKRSLAGVRGYHYKVFGDNPDPDWIKAHFNATLLASNEAVIKFVLLGRAEVGIVPEAIVLQYLDDPAYAKQLLVADRYDSQVKLSNLLRPDGPISVEEMNAIVAQLRQAGDVARLARSFNLNRQEVARRQGLSAAPGPNANQG